MHLHSPLLRTTRLCGAGPASALIRPAAHMPCAAALIRQITYWLRMDKDVFQSARFQRADNTEQETTWLSHILEQASHMVTSMCRWPPVRARVVADNSVLDWLVSCASHRMPAVAAAAANALATATQDESSATAVSLHDSGRVVYNMVRAVTRVAKTLAADHAQGVEDGHPDPFILPPRGGGASIGAFQRGKARKQNAALASQLLLALGNVSGCTPGRKVLAAKGTEAIPQLLELFKTVRVHHIPRRCTQVLSHTRWCHCHPHLPCGVVRDGYRPPGPRSGTRVSCWPTSWAGATRLATRC